MRLGVFGGTFDPLHTGHLILAEASREQLQLDRVLFIPAGDPWRKSDREITPASQRLDMVRLATADNPNFEVDDCEVAHEGPSYTVDTLRSLSQRLPEAELYLILGEDALADLPNWRDPAGIASQAMIAVVPRGGIGMPWLPFPASRLLRVEMPYIGISATELRRRSRRGLSLRYLVPAAVEAYIREQGLYRG
ncbi:MAG: nicotinate-nucleotide adenylyltransferase [Dehalococcoidia bacterium]|nr:nicotinate-nucleotide adenylyltransferase [Dehalococcoidia bacterium]